MFGAVSCCSDQHAVIPLHWASVEVIRQRHGDRHFSPCSSGRPAGCLATLGGVPSADSMSTFRDKKGPWKRQKQNMGDMPETPISGYKMMIL